jgi:Aspartyl protease
VNLIRIRIPLLAAALLLASPLVLADDAPRPVTRIFTNVEGKKIEAEILSKSDNHVRIRTLAGKEFPIELKTLSEADREFIRSWVDPRSKEAIARTDIAEVMKARGFTGIPFTNHQNHLFIDFEIGGKPVTFLLDSGAMTSIVTPAAAEELGLEVTESQAQVAGVGGGAKVEGQAKSKDCRFGDGDDVTMDFVVMDLPVTGKKIDGLIGSDFFRSHHAMLDYSGETLWLRTGEK